MSAIAIIDTVSLQKVMKILISIDYDFEKKILADSFHLVRQKEQDEVEKPVRLLRRLELTKARILTCKLFKKICQLYKSEKAHNLTNENVCKTYRL